MKERYKMKSNSSIPASIMAVPTRTATRRNFLICALCSLAMVASAWSVAADEPVSIYHTYNQLATPNRGFNSSWVGPATLVIGTYALTAPSSTMDVIVTGDVTHCTYTYTIEGQGTLVITAVCFRVEGHGAWHVAKSTGVFEHFKGSGTQEFGPLPAGSAFAQFERFAGTGTLKKHGHHDHDDNDQDD
ncbi:MAG: hypothetical protein DME24_00960 [Verrucomicrobia bacterium]|nr:MAG: hypothetical protein DME24_00960 [Verrucomicrobiota bacterium]